MYPWMITWDTTWLVFKVQEKSKWKQPSVPHIYDQELFTDQFPPAAWFILLFACTLSFPSSLCAKRQRRIHVLLDKQPWPYASAAAESSHTAGDILPSANKKGSMWKRRRRTLPAAQGTMESEGSDKRQDILTPLHLGPSHTAADTSSWQVCRCQSYHTEKNTPSHRHADWASGSPFHSQNKEQTDTGIYWLYIELWFIVNLKMWIRVKVSLHYIRVPWVCVADLCGPNYSHTQCIRDA